MSTVTEVNGGGSHRRALLREGLNQLFENGYHGTTVDRLLEAAQVPKGSFYHHFHTKEEFASAVLDQYGRFHRERLEAWSGRDELTTADKLTGYFDELSAIVVDSGFVNTDLAGKLATEVTATSSLLRKRIAGLVREWREQLEQILAAGQSKGDVRADRDVTELSAAIHALVDGAFVVATATRQSSSLESVGWAIHSMLAIRSR